MTHDRILTNHRLRFKKQFKFGAGLKFVYKTVHARFKASSHLAFSIYFIIIFFFKTCYAHTTLLPIFSIFTLFFFLYSSEIGVWKSAALSVKQLLNSNLHSWQDVIEEWFPVCRLLQLCLKHAFQLFRQHSGRSAVAHFDSIRQATVSKCFF